MTMDHHGGMNLREEIRRKRGMGQYQFDAIPEEDSVNQNRKLE